MEELNETDLDTVASQADEISLEALARGPVEGEGSLRWLCLLQLFMNGCHPQNCLADHDVVVKARQRAAEFFDRRLRVAFEHGGYAALTGEFHRLEEIIYIKELSGDLSAAHADLARRLARA